MKKENLLNEIPVFPLSNAIFFPKTILPLNIFEDRYLQLVNDCMKGNRMFGMVQPRNSKGMSPETGTGRGPRRGGGWNGASGTSGNIARTS